MVPLLNKLFHSIEMKENFLTQRKKKKKKKKTHTHTQKTKNKPKDQYQSCLKILRNKSIYHTKKTEHYNQMKLVSGMQVWFSVWKPI